MKKQLIIILSIVFSVSLSYSADYYWAANSGNNWNTIANWTDGGGFPIGSIPGSSDIVHFTNSNNGNCTIDVDVEIGGLILDGYTGIIDINGYAFKVTSGDCTFNSGTINGGTLTINTSGTVTFEGTTFGAIVNSKSAELHVSNTIFNSVTTLEKTGASNDYCDGGNTFGANTTIINSGNGYLRLQRGNPDTFNANVDITNSGSSYILFAYNSAGNTISGDYTSTNSGDGDTFIETCYSSTATLDITGNCTINNTGTGTQSRNYFALNGTTTIGGNLITNNNSNATRAFIYVSYYSAASLTINGSSFITNNGGSTYSNTYVGYNGDITFNGAVNATNSGSATTSRIYFNYDDNSTNTFNENIIVESTNTNSDGISFGESNGAATLAANKTVTIGAGGYIAGDLRFRNFTQIGTTSQSLTCTGTARIYNYDSDWGGNIIFIAPRIITRGTLYNGTAYIEKTSEGNDGSAGGNIFEQDVELKNTGEGYFLMGNGIADTCKANLTLNNEGTYRMYFAYNSAGNYIAGNLTVNNLSTGSSGNCYFNNYSVSTLTIDGTTTINNNSTATSAYIYFGNNGTTICNGDVTVTNNGAETTKCIYIGNNGDITFNGLLTITNNSSADNSQIYLNYDDNSQNTYNENITVESTDASCDGILFGNSNGSGTLAATKTVTIGAAGYIAGDLRFRNFTQVGNTAQNLTCTGTARIYNYDSDWGGNIIFIAPRIITRGTLYNGTAYIEKTSEGNDGSAGGNIFEQDVELKNTGEGYFLMGNGIADTCKANLTLNNEGTYRMYFAHNSANNYIAGNLVANNVTSGTNSTFITFNAYAASSLVIDGTTTLNNNSTATYGYINFGDHGNTICNGDVNVTNNGGSTTKQVLLGNYGNVTFNGTLTLSNNSSATNSQIYLNRRTGYSNSYNENIIVECTDANCDGILFGEGGGTGTLAATKTVTIGAAGYIAGDLRFRNFTQVGNTIHNITCTGTARIYNYDSNWGGDVKFISPRILTRGTTYNRTAYLEKTGDGNDQSAGGNIFKMDADFVNSGNGYFMLGNGTFDDYQANVSLLNTGASSIYFARSGAGHTIAGDFNVTNNSNETTGYIYVGDQSTSSLVINGNTTVSNNGGNTTKRIYIGINGDITFNGTLSITNNSNATNSQIYLNYGSNSSNTYNENIIVESTDASCDGILFGYSGGNGVLATGKTVTIGTGGYIAGDLRFRNFTQTGNTAQSLHPTGTARIYNYNSEWNGNVDFVSPRIYNRQTTYNGTAYIEKNGSVNDDSYGGNTYNDVATLVNSSSSRIRFGRNAANDYNANVTYKKTGSGGLFPTIQSASTYAADININSNSDLTFGSWSNGRVIFDGTTAQNINNLGAAHTFVFRDIQTNNPNNEITLNTPIEISTELDLDAGNIITTSTNLLYMRDNSIVSSVSNDAYVDGPIEKIGNDAFTFPVGNDGFYAPISMSAPSATNRRFRAQYFHQDADNAGDRTQLDPTLNHISYEEYWTLDRTGAASSVEVTLSWDTIRSGGVDNLTTLRIAHWDGSTWGNEGNGGTTGDVVAGTIVSSGAISSFSPFTLASTRLENPLPVTLLSFTGEKLEKSSLLKWETKTEVNNDYYQLEKSNDGINYSYLAQINGVGNSNIELEYSYVDDNPYYGDNYYRLKQVDFDGTFKYYSPIVINFSNSNFNDDIKLYPNPVINSQNLIITYNNINKNSIIKIVDIKGSEINISCTITDGKISISTTNLDKGTYFAILKTNGETINKMFVVE